MTDFNTEKTEMHMPTPVGAVRHSHTGPILGILVIALVLIFIGLYLWGGMLGPQVEPIQEVPIVNNEPETPRAVADQAILETLSPSDEVSAIEADLSSTNFDSLDAELTTIDAELDAELEVQ